MRLLLLTLLPAGLLAGCAGNIADHVGPRTGIVSPQLIRYGLDMAQMRCVSERLGTSLRPVQLRRLARAAGAVTTGYFEPGRLTVRDLNYVASQMDDPAIAAQIAAAGDACGVAAVAATETAAAADADALPTAARPSAWLNLGAAPSGQAIAVDAASIEEAAATRTAWFRMTNPGAAGPGDTAYQLRIDCGARTISSLVRRKRDAAGTVSDASDTPDRAIPVEGGTVMEIAYLALCT